MTKVISISDQAYEELSNVKEGNSFSWAIINITRIIKKKSILDFAGILTDEESRKIKNDIKETRKSESRRF